MRRISILVAATAAWLAIAGTALASTRTYSGTFDETSATLSFKIIHTRSGAVRLAGLSFQDFPLSCADGSNTETAMLSPTYRPLQPRFPELYFLAVYEPPHSQKPSARLVLTGEVHKDTSVATGVMRIRGRKVRTDDPGHGSTDHCDSGFVRWSALRQ